MLVLNIVVYIFFWLVSWRVTVEIIRHEKGPISKREECITMLILWPVYMALIVVIFFVSFLEGRGE